MTHAEMTAYDSLPAGFEPSACGGVMLEIGSFPDRMFADGLLAEARITVYRCARCEDRVSVREGKVLNCYRGPRLPPDVVLGLAAASSSKPAPPVDAPI